MTIQTGNSSTGQTMGRAAQPSAADLIASAQRLAATYAEARQTLPELPAAYQSARPWFITLGRMVSQHASTNQDRS